MRKVILIIALLSAMSMMAQVYPFSAEEKEKMPTYRMNNYVYTNMGIYARLSLVEMGGHGIFLDLYDTDYDIPRQIYEMIGDGKRLNIRLILENDEILDYKGHYIGKTEDKVKHGIQINLDSGDNYFRKLMNSNISAVGVYGLSEKPMIMLLPSFNSAATLKAMYDKSRSSGTSSSSSNVSSGPSASCELGYIAVFSSGAIRCRVNNLQISGAKGKDVEINAIFENTASDDVAEGFVKKISDIPYDDCTYETLSVKGEADDLIRLMRNYRGRFKVHLEVDIGNRCVYTSNSTYITIYNDEGSWRRN